MPSYSEHEPIRELRRDYVARCFRCNTPLVADLALRSEGLCTACAEGKTIQWSHGETRTYSASLEWADRLLSSRGYADWPEHCPAS